MEGPRELVVTEGKFELHLEVDTQWFYISPLRGIPNCEKFCFLFAKISLYYYYNLIIQKKKKKQKTVKCKKLYIMRNTIQYWYFTVSLSSP